MNESLMPSIMNGVRAMGVARRSVATLGGAASAVASDSSGTARRMADTMSSIRRMLAPASKPQSDVLAARSLSVRFDTLRVPTADLKASAKKADGKLNDAFVAGVAGGLRAYHLRRGSSVPALRMSMPINIRSAENEDVAGNQFAPARFSVPINIEDPIERMRVIRTMVAQQRGEPALNLVAPLSGALRRLPTGISTSVFGSMLRGIDFVTSNVPGAPIPVYLAGARLDSQFAFGPMSGAAINVTLLSYIDEVQIGVNVDPIAVEDQTEFMDCLRSSFEEILAIGRESGR